VRSLLKRHLVAMHGAGTVLLDELGLCQGDVRVDVAAINGELAGFEIKSPADSLARWPKQRRVYSKVVDRAWLVAPEKTLAAAQAPEWWGLIRIVETEHQLGLRVVRPADLNPKRGSLLNCVPVVARRGDSSPGRCGTRPWHPHQTPQARVGTARRMPVDGRAAPRGP
jgi:hypothetical protein